MLKLLIWKLNKLTTCLLLEFIVSCQCDNTDILYCNTVLSSFSLRMSEKLCLKWNEFEENVNRAFGILREDKDLTDVTLACKDGQQMEADKVILYLYQWLT